MFDVYLKRKDTSWRCATAEGAGLPAHLVPSEWELLPSFCLYRLVGLQ